MAIFLISLFNSLFFFLVTLILIQNVMVSSLVAVSTWFITFFALCLSTMAQNSNNVNSKSDVYPSDEDNIQYISQIAEIRENFSESSFSSPLHLKQGINLKPQTENLAKNHHIYG